MKNKKIITIVLIIILLLLGAGIFFKIHSQKSIQENIYTTSCGQYAQGELKNGTSTITVDIADTECKQVLGLSGRKSLVGGQGMLFVFNTIGNYGFWMKDMNFPLDIIWMDNDLQVVGIEKSLATSTYNDVNPAASQIFGSQYSAQYVLEVPADYANKNTLKVGDKMIFSDK